MSKKQYYVILASKGNATLRIGVTSDPAKTGGLHVYPLIG